jgi:hypothetical protein
MPSQSLPNLIHSLADVEKGRSGLPQPSNKKGLRENEDTNLLAKTISVTSSVSVAKGSGTLQQSSYTSKSQTPPTQGTPLSSLYGTGNHNLTHNHHHHENEGQNSYQQFKKEAEKEIQNSLFGATIMAGDKEMHGEYTYQKLECLSDLDMPSHIQDFKQQYLLSEQNRLKLPLLTQLSPRTKKKISLLPKVSQQDEQKIAEYSQIGQEKVTKRKISDSSLANRSLDFHEINKSTTKPKINTHHQLFKQLGDVILKKKNLQYRKNKDLVGRHPAPVILSDQVKALGKLQVNKLDNDDSSQYDHLSSDATMVNF